MDYIQMKESVIKLTDSLKILPEEDKKIVQSIIDRYKSKLSKINNFDENNDVFDSKEQQSIDRFVSTFLRKLKCPYYDRIEEIEDNYSERIGLKQAIQKYDDTWDRIFNIVRNRYHKNYAHSVLIYDKVGEYSKKSKVLSILDKEWALKEKEFDNLLACNDEYKKLQESKEKNEKIKDLFDIDLPLKNYIAYRTRTKLDNGLDNVARESIRIEIEKHYLKHKNKFLKNNK